MRGNWLDDDDANSRLTPATSPTRDRLGVPRRHDRPGRSSIARDRSKEISPYDRKHRKRDQRTATEALPEGTANSSPAVQTADRIRTPGWAQFVTVAGGIAALSVVITGFATGNGETQTAGIVMVVLCAVSMVGLKRIARDTSHGEFPLLVAGLAMKLLASLLRYWVSFSGNLYSRSDAKTYDEAGREISALYLSQGNLPPYKSYTGSNFLRLLTGLLYQVIPPSTLAAFFVFGWFSFMGYIMFWRAMRRTVKPGQDRRYLILLLFVPSVAYWPSSLGKEAVVIFGLGLASLGYARTITNAPLSGAALMGAGVVLVTYVRPHVAIVVLVGIAISTIVRKRSSKEIVGTLITVALFIPVVGFTVGQASTYFNGDVTSQAARDNTLQEAQDRTSQGNSEFDNTAVQITNPVQFPYAAMTVIVRPFPWESPSPQEFATAIESAFVGFLLIRNARQVFGHIRRDNAYAIYAFVSLVVFIVLFSNFNNFGILARQRTQVAPFLFLLMALPVRERKPKRGAPSDVAPAGSLSSW